MIHRAGDTDAGGGLRQSAVIAAVAVAGLLVVAKLMAWLATGSVAILGSLADSLLDLMASAVAFLAVSHALKPPDHDHRFGHGKAEALAGLWRAALVVVSAVYVGWEAVQRLATPAPVENSGVAIGVLAGSAALSLGLAGYQIWVYRRTRSLAIGADAANYATDAAVNVAALGAVWLARDPRFAMADPLFGFAMAVVIALAAARIVRHAYDQLMDREMADHDRMRIKEIILSHPEALGMHDLRTRRSGADLFIQFHLELDPDLTLREAHRIADDVEERVRAAYPDADVMAHQEPVGEFIENDLALT